MRFRRPSELSKGEVRLTEADRQSVPPTPNARSPRHVRVRGRGTKHVTASDDRSWRRPAATTRTATCTTLFRFVASVFLIKKVCIMWDYRQQTTAINPAHPPGRGADYFRTQEVLKICISIRQQTDLVFFYLDVTYSKFQFSPLPSFIARDRSDSLTTESLDIVQFMQTNLLYIKALPGWCWFRICIIFVGRLWDSRVYR